VREGYSWTGFPIGNGAATERAATIDFNPNIRLPAIFSITLERRIDDQPIVINCLAYIETTSEH
jgi:hypothetical protein